MANSNHSIYPPGSTREGSRQSLNSRGFVIICHTQQGYQSANDILDLTVIYEADHQRYVNYVIDAHQFFWRVLEEIKLGHVDG